MWSWLGYKNKDDNAKLGNKTKHNNDLGVKTGEDIIETDNIASNLNIDEKISSIISKNSYLDSDERKNIGGYIYQPEDSYDNIATYFNPKLNKVIIGHRGTSISKSPFRDLYSDFIIATGLDKTFDPRFNENKRRVMDIMDKYGNAEYQHTGHSLGGSHSKAYGKEFGHKSINFNTGAGLDYYIGKESRLTAECNKPNPPKYCNDAIDLGIEGDIISRYTGYGRKKKFRTKGLGLRQKHTIKNYLSFI
jgi:hypothetical protein